MTEKKAEPGLHAPRSGQRISREEVMNILADEGYSADQRKGWLKEVLTQISGDDANPSDPEHAKLAEEIRAILGEQLDRPSVAEDGIAPKS
jgi:hypothetical protein